MQPLSRTHSFYRPSSKSVRRVPFVTGCTVPDRYPVRQLMDFTTILLGTMVYSTLDLKNAFYQIPLHPDDIEKTAVITPLGLYEYTVMTFGLRNADQTFQRFADAALGDLSFVFVHIDDILISKSIRNT